MADRILGGTSTAARPACTSSRRSPARASGAIVANLMFDLPAVDALDPHPFVAAGCGWARSVATFGLLLVILGVVRVRAVVASRAFAVGGYIAAAYWFTSSTSFANPAVTIGRIADQHVRRHHAGSVPVFIVMQVARRARRVALGLFLYPRRSRATDLVVPHRRAGADVTRPTRSRACSSSACTTPVGRRWRSGGSTTSPATGRSRGRAAPSRPPR